MLGLPAHVRVHYLRRGEREEEKRREEHGDGEGEEESTICQAAVATFTATVDGDWLPLPTPVAAAGRQPRLNSGGLRPREALRGRPRRWRHGLQGSMSPHLFALKVLRLHRNAVDAWQQAAREVDILMRVDSPYVVQCHGVVRGGNDRICLVMEYMANGSLRDLLLARRSLPEEVIAVVARRVLEGLRYQHGLGIVHRDIKPANLLVSERGEVQIADFEASRMARAPEGDEPCMGTCAYMSPERFDSEGFGGGVGGEFAGDVWALGVALLECYAGRFPLVKAGKRPEWASLMCMVCFDSQPEVSEAASPEFRNFARTCLEKERRKRGTVEEMLSHLLSPTAAQPRRV